MYVRRAIAPLLHQVMAESPSVLVTGPRQSGKTILVRAELPEAAYVSLDDPLVRDFARQDPHGFLDSHSARTVILDEIQAVPELLSVLEVRIDRDRHRAGAWVRRAQAGVCSPARSPSSASCQAATWRCPGGSGRAGWQRRRGRQRGSADAAGRVCGRPEGGNESVGGLRTRGGRGPMRVALDREPTSRD